MKTAQHFDAIVIGSGIGGLVTAGLLAKLYRKRVLVLEQHFEPGGCTHSFRRKGYSWDVGLHVIGQQYPGSTTHDLVDFVTDGRLKWNRFPSDYDVGLIGSRRFAIPSDRASYRQRLIQQFPSQRRAIVAYFRDMRRLGRWWGLTFASRATPPPVAGLLRILKSRLSKLAQMPLETYLASRFRDPELASVISMQWPYHGLHPKRASVAIQALIHEHYSEGAWFPEHGADRIARYIEDVIERHGGAIATGAQVERILVSDRRAEGVRVFHKTGEAYQTYRAPLIFSAVGVQTTFARLLPEDSFEGQASIVKDIASIAPHGSAVTLYIGLKRSPADVGYAGENYFIVNDATSPDLPTATEQLLGGTANQLFVSFAGLNMTRPQNHTMQVVQPVDTETFERLTDRHRLSQREYRALKERLASTILRAVDGRFPGLTELIDHVEVSTPSTVRHFLERSNGDYYGLPEVPAKYDFGWLRAQTPIAGLYLSGQDIGTVGVMGAVGGAMTAVAAWSKGASFGKTRRELKLQRSASTIPPWQLPSARRVTGGRFAATVRSIAKLNDRIRLVEFATDHEVSFRPGQYVKLAVNEQEYREYSIAKASGTSLWLLIDAKFGGPGAAFVTALQPGDTTWLRGPIGDFVLVNSDVTRKKIFVATGTGAAPLLAMVNALYNSGKRHDVVFLFGAQKRADLFIAHLLEPYRDRLSLEIHTFVDTEAVEDDAELLSGRVTDYLQQLSTETAADVYLCGNPEMIVDARRILIPAQHIQVYAEQF